MRKVALIWGAAGGIGRRLARKLKHEGWQVLVVRPGAVNTIWLAEGAVQDAGQRPVVRGGG